MRFTIEYMRTGYLIGENCDVGVRYDILSLSSFLILVTFYLYFYVLLS